MENGMGSSIKMVMFHLSDEALQQCLEHGGMALSTEVKSCEDSLYNWHQRMGHHSMKTIINMANGAVMGMVLEDVPKDIPKLDSCPSCTLAKAQCLPFKEGHTHAMKPLELIHGDLVGPMPVESVGCCKYRFVLMDDYSHASWVLPLRAKSDAPTAFKAWAVLMENGTDSTIKAIMFNNVKEFVQGRMREYCDQKGIHINSSVLYSPSSNKFVAGRMKEDCQHKGIQINSLVPHSPSSNGVAERLVDVATNSTHTMLHDSNLPPRFWAEMMMTFMYLRNRTPTRVNNGITPDEHFYWVKPYVGHIHTFGYIVRIMDDHGAMGYLMGYQYEGVYHVWIACSGVKEVRDITFFEGTAPALPDHGSIEEVQPIRVQVTDLPKTPPGPMITASELVLWAIGDISDEEDRENRAPAATLPATTQST